MYSLLIFLLSILTAIHAAHLPINKYTVQNLGFVTDQKSNAEGIYHDGGGGASQNGYHVQIFADSMTTSDGFNFIHNSVAYYGYREHDDPLNLYTFGMKGSQSKAVFGNAPVGPQGNETKLGANFAIWMLTGMTPMMDGKTILGVFPALNEGTNEDLYSTMVQMEVVDPSTLSNGATPPFTRLGTGRLFYPNEVQYGNFALVATIDGYLYLAGSDKTGVKLARVPQAQDSLADRNHYDYYNSATKKWQPKEPLEKNNKVGNIITWNSTDPIGRPVGPDVGDMWFDNYHQTMVMTWGDASVDGTLWFSYAIDNVLEGTWSEPQPLWTTPLPEECESSSEGWNYQIHAHPGWDSTGKTLLISYASCAQYVSFAKITWD